MDLNIFKAFQIILRKYAQLPVKKLINHYLHVKFIIRLLPSACSILSSLAQLSPPEAAIFMRKSRQSRLKYVVCITINHPHRFSLAPQILQEIQDCIVIGDTYHHNNILKQAKCNKDSNTIAIAFRSSDCDFQTVSQGLDAYLSVCEVFMGHLHLLVTCIEADQNIDLQNEIKESFKEEMSQWTEIGYFRLLQERASRITLEELSTDYQIEGREWGEVLSCGEGKQGVVIWMTYKRLPMLGICPPMKIQGKNSHFSVISESRYGLKIFVKKQYKEKGIEDLDLTTIIFNIKQNYSQNIQKEIDTIFQSKIKDFQGKVELQKAQNNFENYLQMCDRMSQLLDLPSVLLLKKVMRVI